MALVFVGNNVTPNYIALSTDIVDSTIDGVSLIGGLVFTSDDSKWYMIKEDLLLSPYTLPISLTGDISVGAVSQGSASLTENWRVNVTQTVGLTDGELRASSIGVDTGLNQPVTNAELRAQPVIIDSGYIQSGVSIPQNQLTLNYLAWLGSSITDVMDEYVLCVMPIGGSLQTASGIGFKIY